MAKREKTENTEKVVDQEKEAKREAARTARNEAKARLREFMGTVDDDALKADLLLIVGSGQRAAGGPRRTSINTVLRDLFIEQNEISEMDIFKQFKIGQPEMVIKIRIFLKVPNPEDRIWVKFFKDEEIYRIVGTGANPPDGWDGFVPADENIL